MPPMTNKKKLTGKNTLKGEYNVAIFTMIMKNRAPSLNIPISLLPLLRLFTAMGTYLRLLPFLKMLNVMVVG